MLTLNFNHEKIRILLGWSHGLVTPITLYEKTEITKEIIIDVVFTAHLRVEYPQLFEGDGCLPKGNNGSHQSTLQIIGQK